MADNRIALLEALLNTKDPQIEDCQCGNCMRAKETAVIDCPECGYHGTPYMLECACYDMSCPGGDRGRGAGCGHGCGGCPVCEEGERSIELFRKMCEIVRGRLFTAT